jgi:hypothetical protein
VDPSVVGLRATRFPYKLEREHVRFDQEDDENITTLDDSGFYHVFLVLLKMSGDRMGSYGKDLRLFMSFLLCRVVSHGTILPFLPDIPGGWSSHRGSFSAKTSLSTPWHETREFSNSNVSSPPPPSKAAVAAVAVLQEDDEQSKDPSNEDNGSSKMSPLSVPGVAVGGLVTAALQTPEEVSPGKSGEPSNSMTPQTPLIRFPPSVFLTTIYQEYFEINQWLIPETGQFKRFRLTSPILMQMIDCLTYLRHSVDRDDTVLMMVSLYGLFLIHRRGHLEVMPNVVLATDHFYDK